MRPDDGVPQTVAEAESWGWQWLQARCLPCKHSGRVALSGVTGGRRSRPLAEFAARLVCSRCRGRHLEFALGTWDCRSGQAVETHRPIDFSGTAARRPSRE